MRTFAVTKTALAAVCLCSLVACVDKQDGKALAEAGVSASDSLTNYYDMLAQNLSETRELEAYLGALRGTPVSTAELTTLDQTEAAVRQRRRLAVALNSAYRSLENLSSSNVSADTQAAGTSLSKSLQALTVLPNSHVDPSALVGQILGDVAGWAQTHDIVKASKLLAAQLQVVQSLYSAEANLYRSIAQERGNKIRGVGDELVDKGFLGTAALIQEVPEALGLEWTGPNVLPGSDIAAVKSLLDARIHKFAGSAEGATDAEAQMLAQMVASHKALIERDKHLSLADFNSLVAKANAYLQDIQELRESQKKAELARRTELASKER
jgi:hypothetical protein